MLQGFESLFRGADAATEPVAVAAVGAADSTVLAALRTACDRGWVAPIAVGQEETIRAAAELADIALDGFRIVDARQPAVAAVAEVRAGRARLLLKGQVATPDLLRAILDSGAGLRTAGTICQVVLLELASSRRRILLADTGICIRPTLDQKIDILRSAVEVTHALGVPTPRVALMAATEVETEAMPETVEAAEMQRLAERGEIAGCQVQGPLSFDLAYAADAGERKRVPGAVVGAADVMLFPNLVSANLTVKAIMYTADCRFGGVLCGAACPVAFMSRSDTVATRLNSLALALRLTDSAERQSQHSGCSQGC